MRQLASAVAWIYDFLAEDLTLVVGAVVALIVVALAVHVSRGAAGIVLWAVVVLVVGISLWRTVRADAG